MRPGFDSGLCSDSASDFDFSLDRILVIIRGRILIRIDNW